MKRMAGHPYTYYDTAVGIRGPDRMIRNWSPGRTLPTDVCKFSLAASVGVHSRWTLSRRATYCILQRQRLLIVPQTRCDTVSVRRDGRAPADSPCRSHQMPAHIQDACLDP
jgi:hypothetical protein